VANISRLERALFLSSTISNAHNLIYVFVLYPVGQYRLKGAIYTTRICCRYLVRRQPYHYINSQPLVSK